MSRESIEASAPGTVIIDSGGVSGYALATWLVSQGHHAVQATPGEAVETISGCGASTALIETAVLSWEDVAACVATLRATAPGLAIVLLVDEPSLSPSNAWIRKCGADGAVPADIAPSRLARLLASPTPHQVLSRYGAREVASPESTQKGNLPLDQLTRREREVLACLSDGATTEAIAANLGISVNTVRTHVQNMLNKLGVRSRLELVAMGGKPDVQHITRAA